MEAVPAPELVERFRHDLDRLIVPTAALGLAVSGGPDSLALLLLAAAARPGLVRAATVDHRLRAESRGEAETVATLCRRLRVPHRILAVQWGEKPETGIQEKARVARYHLLADWARDEKLAALLTGHHRDDQAETLLMRLARGSGVKGLAGIRRAACVPGATDIPLLRPLLRWPRAELEQLCAAAGASPASDPSNADESFERVRARNALAASDFLDVEALARSARALAQADVSLDWAADNAWEAVADVSAAEILVRPAGLPSEIRRRLAARAVRSLATENSSSDLRGRELDHLLEALSSGGRATLRGVLCDGGDHWRFVAAPNRTRRLPDVR